MSEKESTVWSPTRLLRYASCPASWARHYIEGEHGETPYPFIFGSLVHRMMHRYNEACVDRRVEQDVDAMVAIVDEVFWAQNQVPQSEYQAIREMCVKTAARDNIDFEHFVDAETDYYATIGGHRFRGKPDALFIRGNQAWIPDYKSGHVIPSEATVKADFKMACYGVLIMDEENYPQVEIVRVGITTLRYAKTVGAVHTAETLQPFRDEIVRRIEQIEADEKYEATPGSYCDVCEFKGDCPALTHAIAGAGNKAAPIVRADQSAAEVGRAVLLTMALRDVKARLKEYVAVNGPSRSSDYEFGARIAASIKYAAKGIYDAFTETDTDPWSLLSVDKRALTKALKHEPGVAEIVEALAVDDSRTKVDLHKFKGDDDGA